MVKDQVVSADSNNWTARDNTVQSVEKTRWGEVIGERRRKESEGVEKEEAKFFGSSI